MSDSKNNPRNISCMPVVVFIVLLDLGKNSLFMDRHYTNSGTGARLTRQVPAVGGLCKRPVFF